MRYLKRGDWRGLYHRMRYQQYDESLNSPQLLLQKKKGVIFWGILTTPHNLFLAHLLAHHLKRHGWLTEILLQPPKKFHHDYYILLGFQLFSRLPGSKKGIIFQLEQSVSSRWFTPHYLKTLNTSFVVLEYALVNIPFLKEKGIAYPHLHYLPIGALEQYENQEPSEKIYDVLFYGDSHSCKRRRDMLHALQQHFRVEVVSEVFGPAMVKKIKSARLVINIHYYENALLEMPRIQECLSLGTAVVSESAQDQNDYPEIMGAVHFFEQGSITGMVEAVTQALKHPISQDAIFSAVRQGSARFSFMFDRFLIAQGFLPASAVRSIQPPQPLSSKYIVLSLPETIDRRRLFEMERLSDCFLFDGIRRRPGWIGCGLSYAFLARQKLQQGQKRMVVMEDDVLLPPDFEGKMEVIEEFLEQQEGEWDIFAGLISDLHPLTKILAVKRHNNITFVTINKMTSTVFNIYSEKALRLLSTWDPENTNAQVNTIDRFLESQEDLKIVVTLPFFVGHREDAQSTLWGFQNIRYSDLIRNSEALLTAKVLHYEQALETELQ